MNAGPALAPDTAMMLGLASTAMPFARSSGAAAERWLRILRLRGEVGTVLQALGVSEGPARPADERVECEQAGLANAGDHDAVAQVTEHAVHIARERGASEVATTDLLMAVMRFYGADFDRVLLAHGTNRDEVIERLGARSPTPA